jgi:hypothetical protein
MHTGDILQQAKGDPDQFHSDQIIRCDILILFKYNVSKFNSVKSDRKHILQQINVLNSFRSSYCDDY